MEFKIGTGGEVKVVLVYKDDEFVEVANDAYLYAKDKGLFKGNVAETYSNITYNNDNVIFLGMGERNKLSLEVLRKSFCALGKEAIKYKVKSIDVELPKFDDLCYRKTVMSVVEGLLQSEYSFEKFLTEKKLKPISTLTPRKWWRISLRFAGLTVRRHLMKRGCPMEEVPQIP